jgi:hypothetical protein
MPPASPEGGGGEVASEPGWPASAPGGVELSSPVIGIADFAKSPASAAHAPSQAEAPKGASAMAIRVAHREVYMLAIVPESDPMRLTIRQTFA